MLSDSNNTRIWHHRPPTNSYSPRANTIKKNLQAACFLLCLPIHPSPSPGNLTCDLLAFFMFGCFSLSEWSGRASSLYCCVTPSPPFRSLRPQPAAAARSPSRSSCMAHSQKWLPVGSVSVQRRSVGCGVVVSPIGVGPPAQSLPIGWNCHAGRHRCCCCCCRLPSCLFEDFLSVFFFDVVV